MKKKFLASLLSMLLIFSTIPTITYATETDVETVAAEAETEEETAAVVAETEAQTAVIETETEAQTAADEAGTEREAETSTEEITELQENPDTEFPEETEEDIAEGVADEDDNEENVAISLESEEATPLLGFSLSAAATALNVHDLTIEEGATLILNHDVNLESGGTLKNYGTIEETVDVKMTGSGTFYNYGIYQISEIDGPFVYDLTLSSIVLSSSTLSPTFEAGTREYEVSVDNSVASIDITPTLNTGTGVKSMTVNGTTATSGTASTVSLSVGVNSIPIVITANDGNNTTNTYTLTVTRQSASCSHSSYTNGFCDDCGAYQPATLNGSTYEISNAGQLFWFASLVNGDTSQGGISGANEYANGILTEDIDLGNKDWIPIGNYADLQSHSYRGTFDGGGHTISGLYINNSSSNYQGLFGCVRDGTVQNVTVSGSVSGNAYVGGVVGAAEGGTVTNCGNSASISGNTSVGGVVGSISNSSTVKYCINSGKVNASLTRVGGVVGNNSGTVTYCYNIGEVSGSDMVGGIVGNNNSSGTVSNCYYLESTATAAIGLDNGTSTSVAVKTSTQFASGEVAYLLNGSVSGGTTWYQNIDNGKTADSYPVLSSSSGTVYYGTDCAGTAIYSNSEVPTATHSLTHVETQGATCTETGNNEYWYCSVCGGYFSDAGALGTTSLSEVTIPAKEHSWGATVYTWSDDGKSCTATRTCETDSSHVEEATATVTGVETKAATCTESGETTYTAVFSESWASEQTKVVADISATGHSWGTTVYTWSDDGKSCTATRTCETDSSHVEESTATVTGVETKAATCTENGETTYTAVFSVSWASERTKVVADISATGHSWGATVYTWSADGKSCTATRTCETDSSHVEEATATVTGVETKAATCTESGETTYTAVFSESWASEQTKVVADISATGHSWGTTVYTWSDDGKSCTATRTCETDSSHVEESTATVTGVETKAATCTENGETTYTAVFGESWASEQTKVVADISATGHNYEAVITEPTYTEQGYTVYTCTNCGDSYMTDYTSIRVIDGTDENLSTKTLVQELTAVPEGLKSLYSSVDELISELISRVTVGSGYTADNAFVYDVILQYRINGGEWINATVDNFPATGITVTLPYPEGTDSSYEFTVLHMFTETSSRLGITAGGTETPTITKSDDGLVVTLTGLSPVAVSWKEAEEETEETESETTTESAETESAATKSETTAAESESEAETNTSPQTGDHTPVETWLAILILSAAAILVMQARRKRENVQ